MNNNKHLWLVLLFHLTTLNLFSQTAWMLFPYQQRTYWQKADTLARYDCDSVVRLSNNAWMYLMGGSYLTKDKQQPCFSDVLYALHGMKQPPVDTFWVEGNVWSTRLHTGQWLTFHPNTPVGQAWTVAVNGVDFDQVRFICTRQALTSVLGTLDSVKTFVLETQRAGQSVRTAWTGATFELTKSYGLRQWYPFAGLHTASSPTPMTLAGVARTGVRMGFTHEMSDFFQHIKPGVVLKYSISNSGGNVTTQEIARDSVWSVASRVHGIRIDVARRSMITTKTYTGIPPNWNIQETQQYNESTTNWTFADGRFHRGLTPHWFAVATDGQWEAYSPITQASVNDWRSSMRTSIWSSVSSTGCRPVWDGCYYSDVYSTQFGLMSSSYNCVGSNNQITLIGFLGDGIAWGDYRPVSVGTHNPQDDISLQLSPNPVSDHLRVGFETHGQQVHYHVYNLAGQIVRTGRANGSGSFTLPVSDLAQGLHFLHLWTPEGLQARGRFVKN